MQKKEIEHLKKIEEQKLHVSDINDNLEFLRFRKQQHQDYLHKTEYLKHAFNKEVQNQFNQIIEKTKQTTVPKEQSATDINPRMIVSWKKSDELFKEVRQRKLVELQGLVKIKPPTQEAKAIVGMLSAMKTGKIEKVPDDFDLAARVA